MNFTREPIVETVITPKEGFKLIIRNSSGSNSEEYSVNAVEVVSFGHSYFFRNMEKPKAFLLPLSEYEVIEARETRTVLKKPQVEKSIKIGKESKLAAKAEAAPEAGEAKDKEEPKKKERKRTRKRREKAAPKKEAAPETGEAKEEQPASEEEEIASPAVRRTLLPPPTSLISEQISRYKDYLASQGAILPEEEGATEEEANKIENLEPQTGSEEDLSFSFGEEATPQTPSLEEEKEKPAEEQPEIFSEETTSEEEKIVDIPSPTPDGDESR